MEKYNFQNCQKIVIFSKDFSKVLLCKRKDEKDYDGVFGFPGGKMETTDQSILEGLKREKNEELGENFKIRIYQQYNALSFFTKHNNKKMILPHFLAIHEQGNINLNEEYSEYQWINIEDLETFEPKIPGIDDITKRILKLRSIINLKEFSII